MDEYPEINNRIKELVEEFCNGNVQQFVRMVGIKNHQNLNRIFNIDKRSGKYPKPTSEILTCIKLSLTQVNYDWLLTGEGNMLKTNSSTNDKQTSSNIEALPIPLEEENKALQKKVIGLMEENMALQKRIIELLEENNKLKELEDYDNNVDNLGMYEKMLEERIEQLRRDKKKSDSA